MAAIGTPDDERDVKRQFESELANPSDVIEWYAKVLNGEIVNRTSIKANGPLPLRLAVIVRLDPSQRDGYAIYPVSYDDRRMSNSVLLVCRRHFNELIEAAKADGGACLAIVATESDAQRISAANKIWTTAHDPLTLADTYLMERGINNCQAIFRARDQGEIRQGSIAS